MQSNSDPTLYQLGAKHNRPSSRDPAFYQASAIRIVLPPILPRPPPATYPPLAIKAPLGSPSPGPSNHFTHKPFHAGTVGQVSLPSPFQLGDPAQIEEAEIFVHKTAERLGLSQTDRERLLKFGQVRYSSFSTPSDK